tara:strand:+ start:6744 stop:6878 length:135 start_codon:yes stop_codon:yes gene_type:complete
MGLCSARQQHRKEEREVTPEQIIATVTAVAFIVTAALALAGRAR